MPGVSHGATTAIAKRFPWNDYKTFVDVGAAPVELAVQLAWANPHLQGVGMDLPAVAPIALPMSLNMLIETLDYTGRGCSSWMREAGFRTTRVEVPNSPMPQKWLL